MTNLPDPSPLPRPYGGLTRDDLIAALAGLPADWYLSRDLLPRVNYWLASRDRGPVTAVNLGAALWRVMGLERKNIKGHVSAFLVTPASVAGRDWFTDTSAGTDPAADKEQP